MIAVEDPSQAPDRVYELVGALDSELRAIQSTPDETLADAQARIDAVVAQFQDLAANLTEQRSDTNEESSADAPPTSTPTSTPGAATLVPAPSSSPSPTATPSPAPVIGPSLTATLPAAR